MHVGVGVDAMSVSIHDVDLDAFVDLVFDMTKDKFQVFARIRPVSRLSP